MSANMMATWTPWKNLTRPPLTFPAATAKIAPTRIGQHQEPIKAGMAAHRVQMATQSEPSSSPWAAAPNDEPRTFSDALGSSSSSQSRHSSSSSTSMSLS